MEELKLRGYAGTSNLNTKLVAKPQGNGARLPEEFGTRKKDIRDDSQPVKLSLFKKPSLVVDLSHLRRSKIEKLDADLNSPGSRRTKRREPEEEFFVMTLLSEILTSKSKNSVIESQ